MSELPLLFLCPLVFWLVCAILSFLLTGVPTRSRFLGLVYPTAVLSAGRP
jgi:hypothetical protein